MMRSSHAAIAASILARFSDQLPRERLLSAGNARVELQRRLFGRKATPSAHGEGLRCPRLFGCHSASVRFSPRPDSGKEINCRFVIDPSADFDFVGPAQRPDLAFDLFNSPSYIYHN